MRCLPCESSVVFRDTLTERDYREAILLLEDAIKQSQNTSRGCSVCYDTGHTAEQCHHNPLVMARRAAFSVRTWRCFHCDEVFTDTTKAEEHFGIKGTAQPKCLRETFHKELIEQVDFNTKELLESVFGDEPIATLTWDNPCEPNEVKYELEVVLRRKAIAPINSL